MQANLFYSNSSWRIQTSEPQVTNIARQSGRKHLRVVLFTFDLFRLYRKWNLRTNERADMWEDTHCNCIRSSITDRLSPTSVKFTFVHVHAVFFIVGASLRQHRCADFCFYKKLLLQQTAAFHFCLTSGDFFQSYFRFGRVIKSKRDQELLAREFL